MGEAPDIEVHMETPVTLDLVREIQPDAVVVATGARRDMPAIPGSNRDFVFSGDDMRSLMLGENMKGIKQKASFFT